MKISLPQGIQVGGLRAERRHPGPTPPREEEEPPLASDEEWVTDSEDDTETPAPVPAATPAPQRHAAQASGMRMHSTRSQVDFM